MEQAILAAEVGCRYISPFVHELKAFFDATYDDGGPNLQLCLEIQQYYQQHGYLTTVKAAGLLNADEAKALSGVRSMTIAPDLLRTLSRQEELGEDIAAASIFKHELKITGSHNKAVETYIDNESKYQAAFAERYGGKGAWKTKQAIDIFEEYQLKAEELMRDNDPTKDIS
ncbi:MAG: hypothetical protein Q9219_001704 [cf. Caloplaca sp. 3 TL-2023]